MNKAPSSLPALGATAVLAVAAALIPQNAERQWNHEHYDIRSIAPIDTKGLSFERRIALVLQRFGDWAKKVVETDYSNRTQEAQVHLRLRSKEAEQRDKRRGSLLLSGMYDPRANILLLTTSDDPEIYEENIKAVAHELGHFLHDSVGQKGIFFQRGYRGPSWQEIAASCQKKVQGPEFKKVLERLTAAKALEYVRPRVRRVLDVNWRHLVQCQNAMRHINEKIKRDGRGLNRYWDAAEFKALTTNGRRLFQQAVAMEQVWAAISKRVDAFDAKKITPEDVQRLEMEVCNAEENMRELPALVKAVRGFRSDFAAFFERAEQKRYDEETKSLQKQMKDLQEQLEKEKDLDVRAYIQREIEDLAHELKRKQEWKEMMRSLGTTFSELQAADESLANIAESMAAPFQDLVAWHNARSIDEIFGTAEEIFARYVSSLIDLYFGEAQQSFFELDEAMLQLFDRMEFEGEKIFGTAVTRYRLARKMVNDGLPVDYVQQRLLAARRIFYRGELYDFPEPHINIKGHIPKDEQKR